MNKKNIKHHKPLVGIPIIVIATFFNAAMATMVKLIIHDYALPNQLLVFFRFAISFCLILPILFFIPKYRPLLQTLKIKIWQPYAVRMIAGMLALYAYFYTIQTIPLSTSVLLTYTCPLFIPIVSWVWRGNPIAHKLWWGLGIGFLGVTFIVGPKFEHFQLGYFIGLLSGIFAAISYVAARLQNYTEEPIAINFYFFLGAALISFFLTAKSFFETVQTYPIKLWIMLILLGIFGALYQGLLIIAVKWTQPRFLGAFLYLAVGYAILIERFLFKTSLNFFSIIGLILVVSAGVIMALLNPASQNKIEQIEN